MRTLTTQIGFVMIAVTAPGINSVFEWKKFWERKWMANLLGQSREGMRLATCGSSGHHPRLVFWACCSFNGLKLKPNDINVTWLTHKRKYSPQLDAFPAMLGPTPRYSPFHPSCTLISRREYHICLPIPPFGLLVAIWNFTLSRSSGCMHNTATTPAPSPAAAWS